MMTFLQVWAGLFFFINKVFLLSSEHASSFDIWRRRRILAWSCCFIGIPPWLIICSEHRNWIAFAIEISGIPSLFLGLYLAIKGKHSMIPKWFNSLAVIGVIIGVLISLLDFGGINTITQLCEIMLVIGLLYGTYRLAKDHLDGYVGYIVMNVATATLMGIQGMYVLMVWQAVELGIIVAAYIAKRKNLKQKN